MNSRIYTKKEVYNVGLIGALATISDAHLDAIDHNPRLKLKAVCDLNLEQMKEKFSHHEGMIFTTDYKVVIDSEDIDAIIICTPHHLHAPISVKALEAHKHVLCEKPMTLSLEQSAMVYQAAAVSKGVFVVSYHFEFFPEITYLINEYEVFGPVKRFKFKSSEWLYPGEGWNYTPGKGGVWYDWAPNALSVLRRVLSKDQEFSSFQIQSAKLMKGLSYEIDTKANVRLVFDQIEGELEIDWEADQGVLVAETTLWNTQGDEIALNHATNCIYINRDKIWCGKDSRYRRVYEDFVNRIQSKSSNIQAGMFETELIERVIQIQ